jgi:hypothetical protein
LWITEFKFLPLLMKVEWSSGVRPPSWLKTREPIEDCRVLFNSSIFRVAGHSGLIFLGLLGVASEQLAAQVGFRLNAGTEPRFCSLVQPSPGNNRTPTDAEIVGAYNAQARMARSLHMEAMMRAAAATAYGMGDKAREIPVSIDFAQPDFLRVTGALPFVSSRGFEFTSDGREFRLLVPDHGKRILVVGPVDAPAQMQDQREDLRPQPLIDALRWQEGQLRSGAAANGQANIRELEITLPPSRKGPRTGRIRFDLVHREIDSLAVYDADGRLVSEISYSDWQEIGASPGHPAEACLPKHIRLVQPDRHYEISLRAYQTVLNPQIPRASFHLIAPKGISTVSLDESGKILHH